MEYRREIDGLRALAVIPVILFHAGFQAFSGGFVGVDVFFVISGYLITSIILAEKQAGTFTLINFYERRARRILPALFLVMLVCIPFAWFWLLPSDMKDFSRSLVAVSVFASNILFWRESGYFDTAAELKPLLHTWSLAVEEQYYVLFPIFMMLTWRLGKRWILVLLAIVAIASLAVAQWASLGSPTAAFYLLPTRGWELLIGAFAAFYLSKANCTDFSRGVGEVGGSLGFALILYSVFAFSKATPFPGLYALVPTVGTVLIILFATQQTTIGKFVGNRAFVGIGLVSYSAYLWHQPLFAFERHSSLDEPSMLVLLGLSFTAVILAFFSWKYVETPFRNKQRFSRNKILIYGAVGSSLFVVFGLVGHLNKGFEQRFEKVLIGGAGHLEFHQYIDEKYFDCEPKSIASQALTWNDFLRCKQSKQGLPEIVLLGDSHAEHLFIGLAEAIPNLNIAFYILGGKPYIENPEFKVIFNELLSNQKSQHIFLTFHFVGKLNADGYDLYDGFSATIRALLNAGKSVSLLGDVPRFKGDPGLCVYKLPYKRDYSLCSLSIDDVEVQRSVYRSILKRLSSEHGVAYIDIDKPLCSQSKCSMINEESILYRDKNHLNILGSKIVGSYVAKSLLMK